MFDIGILDSGTITKEQLEADVNAIAPGMVGSERFKAVLEEKFAQKINDIPFGRLAEPEEVAQLCLFLASDSSSYITGQVIGIDGAAII